ncbi:hypothetical protein JKP29_22930 [Vibrio vulnificus]|nr:hypothetical protein [Vibrio vulnificus]
MRKVGLGGIHPLTQRYVTRRVWLNGSNI